MTLSLNEYQSRAAETAIYPGKGTALGLIYCALGMGEAGEVQGSLKKAIRDEEMTPYVSGGYNGRDVSVSWVDIYPTRKADLMKEAGDLLWYLANFAAELGVSLEEIAQANLDKLASRQARGVLGGSGDNR